MKAQEKGFTLLEAIVAVALFAILLQFLLNFFTSMYVNAKEFQEKTYLEDEARVVKDFVCEQIRQSESIQIYYDGGTDPITRITEPKDNFEVSSQPFSYLVLDGGKEIRLKANPAGSKGKGKYQLVYNGGGSTNNLISDQIDSMMITRKQNSDYVVLTCVFCQQGETNQQLIFTTTFSESLAYKTKP